VILFAVARELTQIAHRLPDSFRRSAAAAAFGGALDQEQFSARVSAENLSILDDWKLNRALKRAPTLARFMSLDQESRKHHRRLARGPLLLPGGGFLMFCVWMAIRLVPTCLGSTSSDYSPSGAELSASPTLNATALRASLRASLNDRCVRAMMTPEARLCDALRTVVDGLDVDTPICSSVRMRMELARTASLGQLPAEYLTLTSQVGIAVDERCPP